MRFAYWWVDAKTGEPHLLSIEEGLALERAHDDGRWFEGKHPRQVGYLLEDGWLVSTCLLQYSPHLDGSPCYETMIQSPDGEWLHQERYTTRSEALEGYRKAVRLMRRIKHRQKKERQP